MKIVFDTNIWISDLGLNSGAGAAVRFFIKEKDAVVVVPEIVRLEFEKNFTKELQKYKKDIVDTHDKLLTVFGELKEVILPSDEDINNKASEILDSLDVDVDSIPLTLDAAKSSFDKIMDKKPPSKNKQQFKDGVIWANCLELLNTSDVYLVSNDRDFYKDSNIENGLAPNLWEETKQYPYKLTLFSSLNTLLDDIRVDIDLNDNNLIKGVFEASESRINEVLDKAEFSLGHLPVITKSLFLTENSSQLYMKFDIKYECSDQTDQARTNALLGLTGSGLYDKEKEEFLEIPLDYVSLEYIDTDGQQQSSGIHYISAHATLGHRTIQHTVRHSLSDS